MFGKAGLESGRCRVPAKQSVPEALSLPAAWAGTPDQD